MFPPKYPSNISINSSYTLSHSRFLYNSHLIYTGIFGFSPSHGKNIPISACLASHGPFTIHHITAIFVLLKFLYFSLQMLYLSLISSLIFFERT